MSKLKPENRGLEEAAFNKLLNMVRDVPVYKTLNITIEYLGKGAAGIGMRVQKDFQNSQGRLHGGLIATLVDGAMGASLGTLDLRGVTLELNLNYIAPVKIGTNLIVEALILHAGRNTAVSEASVYNDDRELVAKGRGTFLIKQTNV